MDMDTEPNAMTDAGVKISGGPLVPEEAGLAFERELEIYVAAVAELGTLSPAEFAARYVGYTDAAELAAHAASVLAREETQRLLFPLTKHGIFKGVGAGGVCALVKVEPRVQRFAMEAMAEAGVLDGPHPRLYSSWDSVCYLGPSQVSDASCPSWLHRDARLGTPACDGVQTMVNLSAAAAQDGPAGDACFVYVPGTHRSPEGLRSREELVAAGADPAAVARAFKEDFVQAGSVMRAGQAADPVRSLLWPAGVGAEMLVRARIACRGAVAWDSRVLHSGSLFSAPGRPHPRRTKYVHFFAAPSSQKKRGGAAANKEEAAKARSLALAATKTRSFALAMTEPDPAYTRERFAEQFPEATPLPVYPIAITTPHRGSRKNGSGKFDLFRSGKRQRALEEMNEKLDHPLVHNFFSLPYMLARALHLLHPAELGHVPCARLAGMCAEAMRTSCGGEGPGMCVLASLSLEAYDRVRRLGVLHGL
jgi:hypothetical protein